MNNDTNADLDLGNSDDWLTELEDKAYAGSIQKLLNFQYQEVDWVEAGEIYTNEAGELKIESVQTKELLAYTMFNHERLYILDNFPSTEGIFIHYKFKHVHIVALTELYAKVVWKDLERFALSVPDLWVDFRDNFLTEQAPSWEEAEPVFEDMKIWLEKDAISSLAPKSAMSSPNLKKNHTLKI